MQVFFYKKLTHISDKGSRDIMMMSWVGVLFWEVWMVRGWLQMRPQAHGVRALPTQVSLPQRRERWRCQLK